MALIWAHQHTRARQPRRKRRLPSACVAVVLSGYLTIALGCTSANATPSPTSSPASAAQLSHTVTIFGLLFFAVALIAVVMFIVVVLRLRKS